MAFHSEIHKILAEFNNFEASNSLSPGAFVTQVRIEVKIELWLDRKHEIEDEAWGNCWVLLHVPRAVDHLNHTGAIVPEIVQLNCVLVEVFIKPTAKIPWHDVDGEVFRFVYETFSWVIVVMLLLRLDLDLLSRSMLVWPPKLDDLLDERDLCEIVRDRDVVVGQIF